MKRMINLILSLCMILCLLPAPIVAEAGTAGTCGDNLSWALDSNTGTLTISGTGAMTSAPWDKNTIHSVVIEDGVTSICSNAFESCSSLTEVTIPVGVTAIGNDAFYNCPLETVYYTGSEPQWGLVSIADGNIRLLTAKHVYASSLVVEWNSNHTILCLSGMVDGSAYVTAAFYSADGQMQLVKQYTATQVKTGIGISDSTVDLTQCTATVMILDENYAPIGVPYTPDVPEYIYMDVWLYATENAYIDGNRRATAGSLLFSDGAVTREVDKALCNLTSLNLGQKFVLTIDPATDTVLSVQSGACTVAEDEIKDITYEIVYDTSNNAASNKYAFTIAGETAIIDKVNVLNITAGNMAFEQMNAEQLKAEIANGAYRNDIVRAIDKGDDGDFDYILYTPVEYAVITKVATSVYYGDYVRAMDAYGNDFMFNGGTNLYIEDCFVTEDNLVVGNYVKLTWNLDEGKFNLKVLTVGACVEFESRAIAKNQYTFSGVTYYIASNAFEDMADLNAAGMLGDNFDIVIDGDLLVLALKHDDNYQTMDEVNAYLAVFIKSDVRIVGSENTQQVKLLTIDGETNWFAYDLAGAIKNNTKNPSVLTWDMIADTDLDGTDAEWDQLVIVHSNENGEVYLEKLVAEQDLNLPTELVDLVKFETNILDIGSSIKYGNIRVSADNLFFAKIDDEYTIITMPELELGTYNDTDALVLINNGTYYDTVVGGYFIIGEPESEITDGYLFVLDTSETENADGSTTITVLLNDGTEMDVEISNDPATLSMYGLYYYYCTSDIYTLSSNWDGFKSAVADEDGCLWYGKDDACYLSDYDLFALKNVTWERTLVDGQWFAAETVVEFLSAEDLEAFILECVEADASHNFSYMTSTDTTSCDDSLLLVIVDTEMYANQYE